jgi:hypothetical protein
VLATDVVAPDVDEQHVRHSQGEQRGLMGEGSMRPSGF